MAVATGTATGAAARMRRWTRRGARRARERARRFAGLRVFFFGFADARSADPSFGDATTPASDGADEAGAAASFALSSPVEEVAYPIPAPVNTASATSVDTS